MALRLGENPFVVRDVQPKFTPFRDRPEIERLEGRRIRESGNVGGTHNRLGVGLATPCRYPLCEGEWDPIGCRPLLEAMSEFLRRAEVTGVKIARCAFRKSVIVDPRVNQLKWIPQTESPTVGLFRESLVNQMSDDARDETRAGSRARHDLGLSPLAVAIRQQAPNDPGTLTDKNVSGLKLIAERTARQGTSVHVETIGPQPRASIEIDGGDSKSFAGFEYPRRELGCYENWRWEGWGFCQTFQPRKARFQFVEDAKRKPASVEIEFNVTFATVG